MVQRTIKDSEYDYVESRKRGEQSPSHPLLDVLRVNAP